MTSVPENMNATHASGAQPTVNPSTAPKDTSNSTGPAGGDSSYPEQKHAGRVGLGPNYRAGATLEDKIKGLKEELKGKVTHKPELVEHGRELISGEERRKKLTGEDEPNPFQAADEEKKKEESKASDGQTGIPAGPVPHDQNKPQPKTATGHSVPVDANPQSGSQQTPSQSGQVSHGSQNQNQGLPHSDVPVSSNNNQSGTHNSLSNHNQSFPAGQTDYQPSSETGSTGHHVQLPPDNRSPSHSRQETDKYPSSNERTDDKPSSRLFQSESDADPSSGAGPKANPFGMAVNGGHGKGAMEQAATVAPEGTHAAEKQRQGNNVNFTVDAPSARQ
ncbi:hypothetical protein CPC08DRAFT_707032 [Agrocybe pediades]|nr:hypothetical protein CPC08DRAFT_707032 [Agrocybe pediades]